MDAECFGGEEGTQYSTYPRASSSNGHQQQQQQHGNSAPASGAGGGGVRRERARNAFMLVYDRAMPNGQPGAAEESFPRSPMSSPSSDSSEVLSPTSPPTPIANSAAPAGDASKDGGALEGGVRAATVGGVVDGGGGGGAAVVGTNAQADRNVELQRLVAEGGGGGGARGRERRKRFRAEVPAVFMRQIHQENLEFWRCVRVYPQEDCGCTRRRFVVIPVMFVVISVGGLWLYPSEVCGYTRGGVVVIPVGGL